MPYACYTQITTPLPEISPTRRRLRGRLTCRLLSIHSNNHVLTFSFPILMLPLAVGRRLVQETTLCIPPRTSMGPPRPFAHSEILRSCLALPPSKSILVFQSDSSYHASGPLTVTQLRRAQRYEIQSSSHPRIVDRGPHTRLRSALPSGGANP